MRLSEDEQKGIKHQRLRLAPEEIIHRRANAEGDHPTISPTRSRFKPAMPI
jgi:hypothetical protein